MIVCEPRANERIPVTWDELDSINAVVAGAAGRWNAPNYIKQVFDAVTNRRKKVYLRSEGWHQFERYNGEFYKHVTLNFAGWTYHFYTKVKSNMEPISADTHSIDSISYQGNKGFVELVPTS